MFDPRPLNVTVNGATVQRTVDSRVHLADFLRKELGLTGTHIGCEHGVCGACTVLVNGASVRACLMLAVQAEGCAVQTIESVAAPGGALHPIQSALARHHGLQCGYCTPGVVMTLLELQRESAGRAVSEHEVRAALSGNLCRCTGYQGMVDAALEVLNAPAAQS
ncbi:MAG: oxidoreductase, 2Fe-2S subunit [Hyphomicrobiales bacterium]|jgi:carbon-monoxide dehydrogenase small subunit|nr:oxidoreductase, 2Fe-2S subunit [Hyphomicrobiales bacterium]